MCCYQQYGSPFDMKYCVKDGPPPLYKTCCIFQKYRKCRTGHLELHNKMLNNFATDLDILLSDLSQSCPVSNPPNFSPLKLGASKKDISHLQETHYDRCPDITEISSNNCRITPISIEQETRPISFWERLEKSRSIWCLPDIGRIGAVHLLKDGIPGMFIVRQSTQKSSMALSVHLSQSDGPVVEHYLIENYSDSPHLQGSDKTFNNVPELIYNYCKNLEDLPQLLVLPDPILKAETSQQLTSLALLGQAFWTSDIMKKSISAQKNKSEKCSLHKSLSEPTSMSSKALNGNKLGQVPPHNSTNTIPAGSTGIRLTANHKTKPLTNYKSKSNCPNAGCCKSKSKTSCSDSHLVTSCISKTNQQQHSDGSSREGSVVDMKVHRSHTHPQINTLNLPQTELQSGPAIDHLSVPQYFHSNLSDKLSDYEDVWKNSPSVKSADIDGSRMFSDSEAENNCTLYIPKKNADSQTEQLSVSLIGCVSSEKQREDLYAKSSHDVSFKHQKAIEDLYSKSAHDISYKFKKASSPDNCRNPTSKMQHSAVTWPSQSTSSSHVEGRITRRGSTGQTVQYSNKCSLIETCPKAVELQKRNSLQDELSCDVADIAKCNVNMTGSVISCEKTDQPMNKFSEKTKPPPLHNVPYVQKSSDGKTKSPVYTEPFDSIGVNSVIFPPVSSANKQVYGQKSTLHNCRERRKNRISHQPTLETIYSPSVTPNTTIFSFDKYKIKNGKTSSDMNNNANQSLQMPCYYSQNENHKKTDKIELKYSDKGSLHNMCSKVADNILLTMNVHESKSNSQTLHKFPVNPKIPAKDMESNFSTLEDLISPQLTLKPMEQPNLIISSKTSEYDNLNQYRAVSLVSDAGTVFSKPWDSEKWDNILKCDDLSALPLVNPFERIQEWQELSQNYTQNAKDSANFQNRHSMTSSCSHVEGTPLPDSVKAQMLEHKVMKELIAKAEDKEKLPMLSPNEPFDKHLQLTLNKSPGMNLKEYVLHLASSPDTFGLQIKHFVECTKESQETNPRCVMSNVRQFMTGMKNYLFHNNQKGLDTLIKRESSRVSYFINAIIESSLHESVILPLKKHIYQLLAADYTKNGSVETLYKNIVYARTRPLSDLGLRGNLSPPGKEDLQLIRHHLTQIKLAYSPVKKLENLLAAAYCITNCLNSQSLDGRGSGSVQTDDFLPMLTYVIVDVGLVTAEIEADYMWGLLHSSQVTAEASYYLSTLSSAVLLLKIFKETHQTNSSNGHQGRLPSISDMQGFLKVAFPDEFRDSIIWKTLPIRPNMTTKDVCAMIAHRFRITNPQDYGLFILVNGQEKFLAETTCPQNIKMENADVKQECIFAYKRIAANIAWPHHWQTS
ncbi:uncharacterized protein LOC106875870 [Octopus bimaculoides]|nr:uncharacterized protein LOC106875870 [Octopus bimaculoides]